jgi:hypothetical protein
VLVVYFGIFRLSPKNVAVSGCFSRNLAPQQNLSCRCVSSVCVFLCVCDTVCE